MNPHPEKVHFHNLDALRFLAFLSVFLFHGFWTDVPSVLASESYRFFKTATRVGYLGVNFFFVLSGFLISYLLMHEEKVMGSISVRNFYLRRFLRIWPLYYLLVIGLLFLLPLAVQLLTGNAFQTGATPWRYFFFLSNFDLLLRGESAVPTLNTLWTIAIEEQFYLFWPLLFLVFKKRRVIVPIVAVIAASILFRALTTPYPNWEVHTLAVISDMALGGLLAYCTFYYPVRAQAAAQKLHPVIILLVYAAMVAYAYYSALWITNRTLIVFDRLILGFFFAFVLFEQVFSPRSLFKLGRVKVFTYLGKMTYGLYCYHYLCLFAALKIGQAIGWNTKLWGVLLLDQLAGLLISIVVAALSYRYFEQFFLKLKSRISLSA